jgi:antitoxin component of MazEF toxin-antitoxin module
VKPRNSTLAALVAVLGMLFKPKTVAHALADLHRSADRVVVVIAHNRSLAADAEARRRDLQEAAVLEGDLRDSFHAEADRAERISDRLAELLA